MSHMYIVFNWKIGLLKPNCTCKILHLFLFFTDSYKYRIIKYSHDLNNWEGLYFFSAFQLFIRWLLKSDLLSSVLRFCVLKCWHSHSVIDAYLTTFVVYWSLGRHTNDSFTITMVDYLVIMSKVLIYLWLVWFEILYKWNRRLEVLMVLSLNFQSKIPTMKADILHTIIWIILGNKPFLFTRLRTILSYA